MVTKIEIDPLTRIEGHLAIHLEVENNRVVEAQCAGEMFRGFEVILKGRDPLDAQQITQRICGVCPVSHGMASVFAQEDAFGIQPPENGRRVRNIIAAANYIQSHILHFYQLSALDFIDITAVTSYTGKDVELQQLKSWVLTELDSRHIFPAAPFLPRYDGRYIKSISSIKNYLQALKIRSLGHKLAAVFGGKMPHLSTLVPGGITEKITTSKIAVCRSMVGQLKLFIENQYLDDLLAVGKAFPEYYQQGKSSGNYLSYGAFPESTGDSSRLLPSGTLMNNRLEALDTTMITEDVQYSYFSSPSGQHPFNGQTLPEPDKPDAYSWLKAPRYKGEAMEVGPLARLMVAYEKGALSKLNRLIDKTLENLNRKPEDLNSTLGRHIARGLECMIIVDHCQEWIEQLEPEKPAFNDFKIPSSGKGMGLTEAPRGALGHWLELDDFKIKRYQCVVPTTWNCSPKDDTGNPGTVEQALIGTQIADKNNPIEATRIVRSFDPCIACAVH